MSLKTDIVKWVGERKSALVESYEKRGFKSSGEWAQQLSEMIQTEGNVLRISISGADYTYFLIHGRKAGKWPPKNVIEKWVRQKPIVSREKISERSLVFLIQRKIGEKGIQVPNERNDGQLVNAAFPESALNGLNTIIRNHYATILNQTRP